MIKKLIFILFFIVSLYAKDWKTYSYVINDLIPKKEFKKAEDILEDKIQKHPDDIFLLFAKAQVLGEEGKIDDAIVLLQKILNMSDISNSERLMITNILNKYNQIQRAQENQNIEELKNIISSNGLEFLMIFLSILVGELLARDVNECENLKEEKLLKKYILKEEKLLKKIMETFQTLSFNKIKCVIISFALFLTYTVFITLIIFVFELFIDPNYLQNITSEELKSHTYLIIAISFSINILYLIIKKYYENKNLPEKVAEKIVIHMYENERLFNKDLFLLKKHEEKLNQILEYIELPQDKRKIKEKLEQLKII